MCIEALQVTGADIGFIIASAFADLAQELGQISPQVNQQIWWRYQAGQDFKRYQGIEVFTPAEIIETYPPQPAL